MVLACLAKKFEIWIGLNLCHIHVFLHIFSCSAATIFAYGQTSSGKTYTMRGIAEIAVKDIYDHIKNVSPSSLQFLVSSSEFLSFWGFSSYVALFSSPFISPNNILTCVIF